MSRCFGKAAGSKLKIEKKGVVVQLVRMSRCFGKAVGMKLKIEIKRSGSSAG
jgi:hypothetical protein